MILDILSAASYGRYNRKLVKLTNTITAVYWSEVLDIITIVVRKKKFDENGFFKLDRKYIEDMTGIPEVDQLDCDAVLQELNVLERDPGDFDRIRVRLDIMEQLLISDEPIKKSSKVKVSRSQASLNKKEVIIATMKKCIPNNVEDALRESYESWIDSVYQAGRFLTKVKIGVFVDTVNKHASDIEGKRAILNEAIQTGWDNADWVINRLGKNRPVAKLQEQHDAEKLVEEWTY